jgi:hypothetical protein
MNLCIIRNLTIENDDSRLMEIIHRLFSDERWQLSLIILINNLNFQVHDQNMNFSLFVFHSLIFQLFCLFFSKFNKQNTSYKNTDNFDKDFNKINNKLLYFALNLCQSGAFYKLINNMLNLINISIDPSNFFDIGYFLWFLKFMISNFILKHQPTITNGCRNDTEINMEDKFSKVNTSSSSKTFISILVGSTSLISFFYHFLLHFNKTLKMGM